MANVNIQFNVKRPTGLLNSSQLHGAKAAEYLLQALQAAVSGTNQCDGILYTATDVETLGAIAYAGPAIGLIVCSGGGGVGLGATIAGTAINVAFSATDTATMTALAAAIRASTAVNRKVTATNVSMQVTLAAVAAGQYIDICGVRFTAKATAATLFGEFDVSGIDTADALALATAFNRHPSTAARYRAISVGAIVSIFPSTNRTISPTQDKWANISNPGSFATFTIGSAVPTAGNLCAVIASQAGDLGNECRLDTAAGVGITIATNGTAGFLGSGTGGGAVPYLAVP